MKYLLNPKITFTVTNEKGSTLNRMRLRLPVGLIDLLGQLFVSSSCYLFNQHLYRFLMFADVGLHPSREAGPCFYPCVTKEENEIPKV